MPVTLQPVLVTPSLPLLLAFYRAPLGAAEISRMPEEGPAFYVGLQIGNAELGMVADGNADVTAPQRIRTGPYCMDAATMLVEQHERGIHVV